jgi:hypothetical protein
VRYHRSFREPQIFPQNLKPQAAIPFEIRGEETRPPMVIRRIKPNPTSMISTTTSCRFVELYERRMRRFNLKVLSAAAVALAVALLLMLYA